MNPLPKLGLAGHKEDRLGRTLKLTDFVRPGLAYPAACDLDLGLTPDTDALGNNEVGCCAIAAPGHFTRWSDSYCKRPWSVSAAAVLEEYRNFGYDPDRPEETDNGAYGLDVMNQWRKRGLFGLPPIDAFVQVDYFSDDRVAEASFILGGVFLCFSLPRRTAAGDPRRVDVWDVTQEDGGPLGGHMVLARGSDVVNSWGRRIVVTPAFRKRYAFDAFSVVWQRTLLDGQSFSGLDLQGLLASVREITE